MSESLVPLTLTRRLTQRAQPRLRGTPTIFDHHVEENELLGSRIHDHQNR